jgi:DNA polymerase-3 subunit gamma/tau
VQRETAAVPASADEWSRIVASLELGGLSRQLAANCALKSIDAQHICLTLQERHRALKSEMAEQRLLEALQGHFSSSMSLRIEIGESSGDTPAQQQALADEQKVVDARAQMAQDPFVKAAVQQLDATLLEETVKPL